MKLQGMREPRILTVTAVVAALVLTAVNPGSSANSGEIAFSAVQLFIEYNSTDDDGGLQAFFDGEGWKKVKIVGPDGRTILEITAQRGLRQIGLTEVRFESAEPSLQEVLGAFAPGRYEFEGETIEGEEMEGTATLSHNIPVAATILSPLGGLVDPNNAVIQWRHPGGMASFQVIVSQEQLGVMMTVDLPASARRLRVPPEFLRANREYKFEVLAIAASGNRTITERTFSTP
jgi:hypothetical protein